MRRVSKEEALAEMVRNGHARTAHACTMCALVRSADALRVCDDEHGVVLLDRYPAGRGHLLVVPRAHVERPEALGLEGYLALQRRVFEAFGTLERCVRPRRIYSATLGTPSDAEPAPPRSFAHLHVHVVPVHAEGDAARPAAVFSWSENVSLYDLGEAEALARELREAWPRAVVTGR